jgi:phage tail-like protein
LALEVTDFTATPDLMCGAIDLEFTTPLIETPATFSAVWIVRSQFAYPETETDGALVLEYEPGIGEATPVSDVIAYKDEGLIAGHMYYYRCFIRGVEATPIFHTSDRCMAHALCFNDNEMGTVLYNLLPDVYHWEDTEQDNQLQKYLEIVGLGINANKNYMDYKQKSIDLDYLDCNFLPKLAEQFCLPYEKAIGDEKMKTLLKTIVFCYKWKGTRKGLNAWLRALTGWTYKFLGYSEGYEKRIFMTADEPAGIVDRLLLDSTDWEILETAGTLDDEISYLYEYLDFEE